MTSGSKHGRRRPLTDEERVLWTTVTRTIVPLGRPRTDHPQPEAVPSPVDPEPVKPETEQAPAARPVIRPPAPAPLDRRSKQRLARGSESIDARVDLHGLTQAQAHDLLVRFVRTASAQGARVVLVITGKGGGVDQGGERGVLRRQVPHWLKAPLLRDRVVGFATAHVAHGGDGALYVRLRRPRS
ncbi:MAG TPA: Smr/MutS family protein [Xanthobacteraceae bacterium]|nr:Smr/MutS family protein [Xanthobacteraceae bacterium]